MEKDLKAAVKVKAITYEGDDIFSLDTNYGTIKAKTLNPFNTDEEKPMTEQYAPLAPPLEEPEDIKLFNVVRKLVELDAEFDIKACGVHITNKSSEKKDEGLHDQFSEEYDKFFNAKWYNSIEKTPEEGEEVRICFLTNEREVEENAVFKTNKPTGEPAFFWKTGFVKASANVLWRRFAKCEQTEDK